MSEQSPYAVPLSELEASVHVPLEDVIEGQSEEPVPHDLPNEDMALGRTPLFE